MPKTSPTESLLALVAGRDRAAGIMGDLLELAATRSRGWLVATYLRTLLSLTWRPLAAFLAGAGVSATILYAELPTWIGHIFLLIGHPHIWPPLDQVRSELWFLVPFAAVRYGIRDRVVQLALALLLATSGPFYLGFWFDFDPIPITCIACGLLVAACLAISSPWRAALIPLAGICALGFAVSECQNHIQWVADVDYRDRAWWMLVLVNMFVVSIVFSWLHSLIHRRLQRSYPIGAAHA
jgi:hypothetical protein